MSGNVSDAGAAVLRNVQNFDILLIIGNNSTADALELRQVLHH